MHELYELKEKLLRELGEYGRKELSPSTLTMIDTLAHATKNICKIIESADEEYSEEGGSSYDRRGSSRRGGSSYYRAGSSTRRDSRGRYSSNNYYNAAEEMVEKLDELMADAPDEKIKSEIQRLKQKIEQMQ